jgi:hypothetical protein
MSRLQPINLVDFTGGLNARRSQFTLADNESPALLNVEIDPRAGFYTRKGWNRWNADDIVDVTGATFAAGLSSITGDGATATVTLAGHGLTTGDEVVVSGGTAYDGTYTITVTGADTFTFADTETSTVTDAVITKEPFDWLPKNTKFHAQSDGGFDVYIAALTDDTLTTGSVFVSDQSASFTDLAITAAASPHLADFSSWGDDMYIVCGWDEQTQQRSGGTTTGIGDANQNYNDDYTTPLNNRFPQAEFCETHAGYMFVASTSEENPAVHKPNRLRWSHPDNPLDWAEADYIDINEGGSRITGLLSFRDHLLIFKSSSIWALYGYDRNSWQLLRIPDSVGISTPAALARSESAVYFFSSTDLNGIYAYTGDSKPVHVSEKIRTIMEQITSYNEVTLGWMARRLWVSVPVPYSHNNDTYQSTVFVFDPAIGDGVWTRHGTGSCGCVGPMIERADVNAQYPMATVKGNTGAAAVLLLEYRDDAVDTLRTDYATYITDWLGRRIVDHNGDPIVTETVPLGDPFDAFYRTGWKHAGWPERRKSWLRPRYIHRVPSEPVSIRANAYWDYDESTVRRTAQRQLLQGEGAALWGDFDWGDGTEWGSGEEGSDIRRVPQNIGLAKAVQLEIESDPSTPGKAWGIDGIVLKVNMRRFTT